MTQVHRPGPGPTVLASVDGQAYGSLRASSTPRAERYALGRGLRKQVPRSSMAEWRPPQDRRDVLDLLEESHEGRISWLVPVRVGRMVASPYGFLRGAAVVMAEDFARLPATGITPVICGDAHVGNIGFYGSPERELVLDLNDFDEAHPGSWEWDLRRLVASVWVAGRQNSMSEDSCADAVTSCVASYREQLWQLSDQPLLWRSFQRLDLDRLHTAASDDALRQELDRAAKKARSRTSDRALPRFTEQHEGRRRIVEEPPLTTRVGAAEADELAEALDGYLATLAPHWRRILGGYTIVDIAHKVVGVGSVGSVGLRAYVVLCEGSDPETCCSCNSSRPGAPSSRRSCTATPHGTPTKASGWWSTSRPSDRERPPLRLDQRRRAAVLRAPVPQ